LGSLIAKSSVISKENDFKILADHITYRYYGKECLISLDSQSFFMEIFNSYLTSLTNETVLRWIAVCVKNFSRVMYKLP